MDESSRQKRSLILFWIKISNSENLSIIRNSLTLTLPVVLAGAAAVLINNFPIPIYQQFMLNSFGEGWRSFGGFIWNGTLAVLSPIMTFSIGYSIAERFNLKNPMNAVHPVISGLLAFCSLLLLTESSAADWAIPYNWMSVNGLFTAILAAFISSKLFLWFYRIPRLRIKFFSEAAGTTMTHVFAAMLSVFLTLGIFAFFRLFMIFLGIGDIHAFIYDCISRPFKGMGNTLPTALLFNFARHFLWFFGIHGSNALEPVMTEIYVPAAEIINGLSANGNTQEVIFTKSFFDTYVTMGGAGATLAMIAALLTVRKDKGTGTRRIAQLSLVPGIFNINETLLFGLPVVLNPVYIFPFTLVPLVLTITSWGAVKLGLIPASVTEVAWTTPAIISGYAAAGSVSGSLIQIFNLGLSFILYLPFVRLAEKVRKYRIGNPYSGFLHSQSITEEPGEIGAISQVLANDLLASIKRNEHSLLKNTPGVTFMLDLDLHFLLGSEKTADLLGYNSIQEMAGLSHKELFSRIMPYSWIINIERYCLEVIETSKPITYETKVIMIDGWETVFQVTINQALEQDEICRGVVIVLNDITELYHTREEAEKASHAKGDFLANMSHEMRTPMSAIIGMTNIALNAKEAERKDYCLRKIEDASAHLLGVINDILDISKIEANKFELSQEDFNFEEMIGKVENVINFKVEEKGQRFTVHIDEKIPKVLNGDDQRLVQVITNLLSNAVKFTPEGGLVTLESRLVKCDRDSYVIQIDISDTGIGISPEQQAKLFGTFVQADSGTSRKFGGTGLGLAISKRIVELMGGQIWIESEPNRGSIFSFTVQLRKVFKTEPDLTDNSAAESQELPAETKIETFPGYKILIAEDVEINREIISSILEPTALLIEFAEDGKETVEKFRISPDKYSLIFMDIQMPEMDGYEATRCIRRIEEKWEDKTRASIASADASLIHRRGVPIIAMTANVFREDINKCLSAGMNDHVGKPLDIKEIMEMLKKYLPRS